ncbi:hypothetical protein Taro_051821 [Colocasia esculenta]|uniref:Uncharacterized protein n=1 Tax=Colocasia esculenta TaxID=4460 RepID=A0A843XGY7_COLES|nr:hypothetical protein [Colocasia esculenta]
MVSVLFGGVSVSRAVPCVPALADGPSGGFRKGYRACLCFLGLSSLQASCADFCGGCPASSLFARWSALEGLFVRQVVTVTWDPQPRTSVRGSSLGGGCAQVTDLEQKGKTVGIEAVWVTEVVEALFWCGPTSPSHCLTLRWFWSHVGRLGVGPQFGRTAVVVVVLCCGSLASLYQGGCRQESTAGERERWTTVPWCRSWWHRQVWFPDLVECPRCRVCAEGCFRILFDSTGSAGVVFGPTLVVGHGVSLFRYFVVLCGRRFSLYYLVE